MKEIVVLLAFLSCVALSFSIVTHTQTLLWTEKAFTGEVRIMGIPGDPLNWISGEKINTIAQAYPSDPNARIKSHRIALGFEYNEQRLLFSDRGFKHIYKVQLQEAPQVPFTYNASVNSIFAGTSTKVNGLAVDWVSGNVYWTDALYNWITVGRTEVDTVYRHLITTGLDSPQGIAVDPKKGLMFWSDWGANPRIEMASMGGEDRKVFLEDDMSYPLGIALTEDRVYWVDDGKDTVESANFDGTGRKSFLVNELTTSRHYLFGITLYKDFIFITDQLTRSVNAYNKDTETYLGRFALTAIPYDIEMYDGSLQEKIESECDNLNCEHLCITKANGGGYCMCGQNYKLNDDGVGCTELTTFRKPQYLFSVGTALCGMPIHSANIIQSEDKRADVRCFLNQTGTLEAMAFDAHADWLFFSDTESGTLNRMRLEEGEKHESIHLKRGDVRGISVDWLSGNVYWTDEVNSHIMVSQYDGSKASVVLEGIHSPRGIEVNPLTGLMYWSAVDKIYTASMDGSNVKVFVDKDCTAPDGLVLDLNKQRLLWADIDGIHSIMLNGSGHSKLVSSSTTSTFRDVTVYQDFYAWTDGENFMHFSHDGARTGSISAYQMDGSPVSHDVITYDDNFQPLAEGQCDDENGGCDHLCLPTPNGRKCRCSVGFYLDTDARSCISDLWTGNFILFLEPYHRRMFQFNLGTLQPYMNGINTNGLQNPRFVAYDQRTQKVYWFESEEKVINYVELSDQERKRTWMKLDDGKDIDAMDISSSSGRLFFLDHRSIYYIETTSREPEVKNFYSSKDRIEVNSLSMNDHQDMVYWAEVTSYRETTIYRTAASNTQNNVVPEVVTEVPEYLVGIYTDINDDSCIYYWTATVVMKYNLTANSEIVIYEEADANFKKVFIHGNLIYINDANKGSIAIYDMATKSKQTATGEIFSLIADMKIVKGKATLVCRVGTVLASDGTCVLDDPKVSHVKSGSQMTNTFIIIGAASGAVILLTVLIAVGCCARKRKTKQTRKASTQPMPRIPAHDNPTYMSPEEAGVQPVTVIPSNNPPQENIYEHLPDTISGAAAPALHSINANQCEKDDIDIGPEVKPEGDSQVAVDIAGDSVRVPTISDEVNLVENEEISLQMNSEGDDAVVYRP